MMVNMFIFRVMLLGSLFNSILIFAQREIFVGGGNNTGNGTQASPYGSFKTAIANAQDGDVIKLIAYTDETTYNQLSNGEVEPIVIDKAITIDGQGNRLKIIASPLSLTRDITFKNIKLELPPLTGLVISTTPIEGENYIFGNGNKITFDNVTTKIEGGHINTRPIIIAGTYKNTPDAGKAEIIIKNSPGEDGAFKDIIAGNNDNDKNTPTIMRLGKYTKVIRQVIFGGRNSHRVNAKVTAISSESSRIKSYNGANCQESLLEFRGASSSASLLNILNISLQKDDNNSVSKLQIPENLNNILQTLTIGEGSEANFNVEFINDPDAEMTIGAIVGQGGSLILKKEQLNVTGNVTGTLRAEVDCGGRNCNFTGREVFIEAGAGSDASITFTSNPPQTDYAFKKEVNGRGRVVWKSSRNFPVRNLSYEFNQNTKELTLNWQKPENTSGLTGYEIFKEGSKLTSITDSNVLSFVDRLTANGSYLYEVYAVYSADKSEKVAITANVNNISPIGPTPPTGDIIGRVGINTESPEATLHIKEVNLANLPSGTPQGVSFPNFTTQQRETFRDVKAGTMIYNTTLKCLEYYNGTDWVCIRLSN